MGFAFLYYKETLFISREDNVFAGSKKSSRYLASCLKKRQPGGGQRKSKRMRLLRGVKGGWQRRPRWKEGSEEGRGPLSLQDQKVASAGCSWPRMK